MLRASFEKSEAGEKVGEHLPAIKVATDWSSGKPSSRPPASALTNQFKQLTSSGASFSNCPATPPRTSDQRRNIVIDNTEDTPKIDDTMVGMSKWSDLKEVAMKANFFEQSWY